MSPSNNTNSNTKNHSNHSCEIELGNNKDWTVTANADRVLVRSRGRQQQQQHWTVVSSAVCNGGYIESFPPANKQENTKNETLLQVLNATVPHDYDGVNPNPNELLRQLARKEDDQEGGNGGISADNQSSHDSEHDQNDNGKSKKTQTQPTAVHTIGLLTAASMKTLRIATQEASAEGTTWIVDAIVTAGISNARAAGADADAFSIWPDHTTQQQNNNETKATSTTFGTINTILITNAPLNPAALMEAHAVATEAKCRAVMDVGIRCAKNPNNWATGTGTDSLVLIAPSTTNSNRTADIPYAGKHTLLGELIGQAAYQATKEALEANLNHLYAGYLIPPATAYRLRCYRLQIWQALQQGHRPLVPSKPMQSVPGPQGWVLVLGLLGVALAFTFHCSSISNPDSSGTSRSFQIPPPCASVMLAAIAVDRFLGSIMMPLSIHPVVLVGKLISNLQRLIPEPFFQPTHPMLGLLSGILLFLTTVSVAVTGAWCVLMLPRLVFPIPGDAQVCTIAGKLIDGHYSNGTSCSDYTRNARVLTEWLLHVFLVRGSLSLQLLCNISLQMAHFLERNQLLRARAQLSWLCSRDPSSLNSHELAGGTLESLAENLSDSVVSPLVYYVVFGPLGAFAFRVINTLDSRVGNRGRYEWVGKTSARCDDLLNLFSARLTTVLLVTAASLLNVIHGSCWGHKRDACPDGLFDVHQGVKVAWRDASQCDSPNAGWPMGTMAGLLDVCLEKRGEYALNGPVNGGSGHPPGHHDIRKGHDAAALAGVLAFLSAAAVGSSMFFVDGFKI